MSSSPPRMQSQYVFMPDRPVLILSRLDRDILHEPGSNCLDTAARMLEGISISNSVKAHNPLVIAQNYQINTKIF